MIYTVTLNPALDYALSAEKIIPGSTNRSHSEYILTGGKGINVSSMLSKLGEQSTAFGLIGGFVGDEIEKRTAQTGCMCDFVRINGISRINVKIKSGLETEINACGPVISSEELEKLKAKTRKLKSGDTLVLAGSVPKGVPKSIYGDILSELPDGVMAIVDATGELLLDSLRYEPFLIKPNRHELCDIFDTEIENSPEAVSKYALKLLERGAKNVLVSLAGDGAVLAASDGKCYYSKAPEGKAVDSVGAGDSMVAGFIHGFLKSGDILNAFAMSVSSGSASAFSIGFAEKEYVMSFYEDVLSGLRSL